MRCCFCLPVTAWDCFSVHQALCRFLWRTRIPSNLFSLGAWRGHAIIGGYHAEHLRAGFQRHCCGGSLTCAATTCPEIQVGYLIPPPVRFRLPHILLSCRALHAWLCQLYDLGLTLSLSAAQSISCLLLLAMRRCRARCMRETCWTKRGTEQENTDMRTALCTAASGTGGSGKGLGRSSPQTAPPMRVRTHSNVSNVYCNTPLGRRGEGGTTTDTDWRLYLTTLTIYSYGL